MSIKQVLFALDVYLKILFLFKGFGKADHEITVQLLKKSYPTYNNISFSNEGYWCFYNNFMVNIIQVCGVGQNPINPSDTWSCHWQWFDGNSRNNFISYHMCTC